MNEQEYKSAMLKELPVIIHKMADNFENYCKGDNALPEGSRCYSSGIHYGEYRVSYSVIGKGQCSTPFNVSMTIDITPNV